MKGFFCFNFQRYYKLSYLEKNSVNSEDSDQNLYFEMINEAFVNENEKNIKL